MAPNVCHSLLLLLSRELFSGLNSLLFLLLLLEALSCSLEFLFVDNEEVARSALREVWLCQYVLNACNRCYFTLIIDILQLVHLIGLIYDSVTFFKVDHFVVLTVFAFSLRFHSGHS